MIESTIIICQSLIIIALIVERHFYTRRMTEQLSNATKAVMSRNINEYIAAVNTEKSPVTREPENEEVLLSEADDKVFDDYIKKQNS